MSWPRDARTRVTCKSRQPKFDPYRLPHERDAQAIDARSGETRQRLEPKDESAVAEGHAPNPEPEHD